jgi:hypothetical protein
MPPLIVIYGPLRLIYSVWGHRHSSRKRGTITKDNTFTCFSCVTIEDHGSVLHPAPPDPLPPAPQTPTPPPPDAVGGATGQRPRGMAAAAFPCVALGTAAVISPRRYDRSDVDGWVAVARPDLCCAPRLPSTPCLSTPVVAGGGRWPCP